MITKLRKVHYCEFCNKKSFMKPIMELHENGCLSNPKNKRACLTCTHLDKKAIDVQDGCDWEGEPSAKAMNLFYCTAKDMFLHLPKNEHNKIYLDGKANNPMPMECDKRKTHDECYNLADCSNTYFDY